MLGLIKSAFIAIGLSGIFAAAAQADMPAIDLNTLQCTDIRGAEVAFMPYSIYRQRAEDAHMVRYAGARYLQGKKSTKKALSDRDDLQGPAIVVDELFMQLNDLQKLITYMHECYHLNSGDAIDSYVAIRIPRDTKNKMEFNADCYAIRRIRDDFNMKASDLPQIEALIKKTSPSRHEQPRIANIQACFASSEYTPD